MYHMLQESIMRKAIAALILTVALMGTMAMSQTASARGVHLHYVRGYSVQSSWLCYGWRESRHSYIYHCTQHWHLNNLAVPWSDNPSWVPNIGN